MPIAGTLSQFAFSTSSAAGGGKSWTITVYKNETATGVTCVISNGSATSCRT